MYNVIGMIIDGDIIIINYILKIDIYNLSVGFNYIFVMVVVKLRFWEKYGILYSFRIVFEFIRVREESVEFYGVCVNIIFVVSFEVVGNVKVVGVLFGIIYFLEGNYIFMVFMNNSGVIVNFLVLEIREFNFKFKFLFVWLFFNVILLNVFVFIDGKFVNNCFVEILLGRYFIYVIVFGYVVENLSVLFVLNELRVLKIGLKFLLVFLVIMVLFGVLVLIGNKMCWSLCMLVFEFGCYIVDVFLEGYMNVSKIVYLEFGKVVNVIIIFEKVRKNVGIFNEFMNFDILIKKLIKILVLVLFLGRNFYGIIYKFFVFVVVILLIGIVLRRR